MVIIQNQLGSMMQFKINLSDIRLLIEAVEDTALVRKLAEIEKAGQYYEQRKYPTGRYLIDLSEDEIKLLIDFLTYYLMGKGLNSDGEPNALGLHVETLIDVFNS